MSFGMMVTRFAWIAHKLVSSNKPTRYASDASCSASTAVDWNRRSVLKSCAISRTRRWNGSLRINSSVDFWYFLRVHRSRRSVGASVNSSRARVLRVGVPMRVRDELSPRARARRRRRVETIGHRRT